MVTARAFNRPTSMLSLSRLLPLFVSSPDTQVESGNINAVAMHDRPSDPTGRDVWTIIDFRIQRWNMSTEGWEELILDEDISSLIAPQIQTKFAGSTSQIEAELDLELLDLHVIRYCGLFFYSFVCDNPCTIILAPTNSSSSSPLQARRTVCRWILPPSPNASMRLCRCHSPLAHSKLSSEKCRKFRIKAYVLLEFICYAVHA